MSMNKSRNLYNIYKILLEARVTSMIIFQCHFVVADMSNILSNLIIVGLSPQIIFFRNCCRVFVRNLINLWWILKYLILKNIYSSLAFTWRLIYNSHLHIQEQTSLLFVSFSAKKFLGHKNNCLKFLWSLYNFCHYHFLSYHKALKMFLNTSQYL